jgi:hypothetical protein
MEPKLASFFTMKSALRQTSPSASAYSSEEGMQADKQVEQDATIAGIIESPSSCLVENLSQ